MSRGPETSQAQGCYTAETSAVSQQQQQLQQQLQPAATILLPAFLRPVKTLIFMIKNLRVMKSSKSEAV